MRAVPAFVWLLVAFSSSAQPLLRNFFSTNIAPVVQATAGSNVFVTFSVSGQTRTYRIDVPAIGGVSNIYVAAGVGVTITTNGNLYTFTVSTNYASTNYVNGITNGLAGTNFVMDATNALNTLVKTYTNAVGIIQIITNASPLAMSITGNAATSGTATNVINGPSASMTGMLQYAGYIDDFLGRANSGGINGIFNMKADVSGSGATITVGGNTNCPGSFILNDGTATSASYVALYTGAGGGISPLIPRGVWTNEWRFSVSGINTNVANQNYILTVGITSEANPPPTRNGYYLQYYTNDTHFQYVVAKASTQVTNITTLVPVVGQFYRFRVVVTSTSTTSNAVFTIDGAQGWTNSTLAQLPTGNTTGFACIIGKVDGATSESVEVDYVYLGYGLESSR